jgi:putative transposase
MTTQKIKTRIREPRNATWDYGAPGNYFITIFTDGRKSLGDISYPIDDNFTLPERDLMKFQQLVHLSPLGIIARDIWTRLPQHFNFIRAGEFCVMPDRVSAIITIEKPNYTEWNPNRFGVQSENIPSVIRHYKGQVKKIALSNDLQLNWQAGYHCQIVSEETGRVSSESPAECVALNLSSRIFDRSCHSIRRALTLTENVKTRA